MLQNHPAPESRTLPQHITDEHNGLSYTLHGDYYFPDLALPEQQPIGKWGRLHLRHLESNHPGHFQRLLLTGALNTYLHTVDEQASERFDVLMKGYAQSWGITEALKAEDPIKWVGLMNLARRSGAQRDDRNHLRLNHLPSPARSQPGRGRLP